MSTHTFEHSGTHAVVIRTSIPKGGKYVADLVIQTEFDEVQFTNVHVDVVDRMREALEQIHERMLQERD